MSFELELQVPISAWDVAERLAQATRAEVCVALVPGRRRRWGRTLAPSVHLDGSEGQAVLDDEASWDEEEFTLSERRHALVETLLIAARELPGTEWTLRCSWGGDKIRSEVSVTVDEVADLVGRCAVNRYVLYRVRSASPAQLP